MKNDKKDNLIAEQSIIVDASPAEVWKALITPEIIKQYLFGTEAISDWKEGSSIIYKGEWEGKPYEDKGTIIKVVPEKLLESTYWSAAYGLPDKPENYKKVTHKIESKGDKTKLTITQDNNATKEAKEHSEGNWKMVLEGLKKVVES